MQKLALIVRTIAVSLLVGVSVSACVFPGVYKIDVQQGNIVEKESLEQLRPGLTREQVHYLVGSPVAESNIDDSYETYIYTFQLAGKKIHRQNITLHYQQDRVTRVEKDEILPAVLANPGNAYKLRRKGEPIEAPTPSSDI